MTNRTNSIKDRCRLCYTRLKDSSIVHSHPQKLWCSHHRFVNIYKSRPYSYHELIVRYLCINLPTKNFLDPYSQVICGSCADALDQLHQTFRAFEQTQKSLRSKYRKTCQILRYQIHRPMRNKTVDLPKRQSKRKGAPKHIDQSLNQMMKAKNPLELIVRLADDEPKEIPSIKRKESNHVDLNHLQKRVKSDESALLNAMKSFTSIDSSNNRSINSVKGNHIERIAVSLLSGTESVTTEQSNETHASPPARSQRKRTVNHSNSIAINALSPSFDENDEDPSSNESSTVTKPSVPSTILTTPTAEGLAITTTNPTGQKQVFMAKQLGNLKKYQCGLCEKIVTNIQIHVRRHTNDKPYPCTYCEKRFTNSGDLQIHVRIHTGEKPYACPLCLKSYRTIGNFNSHVKTHDTGTRPHRCELCNQTFAIPKDWYSHLRSSHRSRTSSLTSPNPTTTVTQPLFSNVSTTSQSQQQQHSEVFIPNKVKLEPINRSQLIIQSSIDDDQEPVNMSTKEEDEEDEENEEDEEEEEEQLNGQHSSTENLLSNGSCLKS